MTCRVLISGATGFVGSALVDALSRRGDEVHTLTRSAGGPNVIAWDPEGGAIDRDTIAGASFDAVIHLAGENIAAKRWSEAQKARIRESRVRGTTLLAETIAALSPKPSVFISASAIGLYGDRGDAELDEATTPGEGFLAAVCREWESSARPAEAAGIRVIHPRIAMVLGKGGALAKMRLPFSLGAGGPLGDGRQWMSWIAIDDLVSALLFAIDDTALSGAFNASSPNPVTNKDFTRALGQALKRPAVLPAPKFALQLAFGDLAKEALLASQRVLPRRLLERGFRFELPKLEDALARYL
jgi:uncharacterized protein